MPLSLTNTGRRGILATFVFLREPEHVTDTRAFETLGNGLRIVFGRGIWCFWHLRSAEAEDVSLTRLVTYRHNVPVVDALLLILNGPWSLQGHNVR
jgi:hypothetical protein